MAKAVNHTAWDKDGGSIEEEERGGGLTRIVLRAASMSGASLGASLLLLFSATKQERTPAICSGVRSLQEKAYC